MKCSIQSFLNIDKTKHNSFSNYISHQEALDYRGCEFKLHGLNYIQRTSKPTPKKNGQFVTLWKRNLEGLTEPYKFSDDLDFVIIFCFKASDFGCFIFPKNILAKEGVLTLDQKGKRGFRVYPPWDEPQNCTAFKTKAWQVKYFFSALNLVK